MYTLVKLTINAIQIFVLINVLYKIGRFVLLGKRSKKRSYKKSIIGKMFSLFANRIGYGLDDMLRAQKEKRLVALEQQQALHTSTHANIVNFDNYKKIKAK